MRLAELIPPGAETGAGLALRHRERYLFMLAGPGHSAGEEGTFCAGIGGHCEPGESWLECARREAREELGATVRIDSAPGTAYIDRHGGVRPLAVDEEPRPLGIYELWNPPEAPWNKRGQGFVYYIVIYEASLDDAVRPEPGDLEAIIWLTPAQVRALAQAPQALQSLVADGAEVRARASLPGAWPVRLHGTARALAILWGESLATP